MENGEYNNDLAFDQFTLTTKPARLLKDGVDVKLRRQAVRLLGLLAGHSGELVSHEDIRVALWGERFVDHVRGTHLLIREIRKALGDDAANPKFIETLPRQGYRFIVGASQSPHLKYDGAQTVSNDQEKSWRVGTVAAVVAVLSIIGVILASMNVDRDDFPETSAAEEAYLKGDYLLNRGGTENLTKSAEYFNAALAIDDSYARAHVGLAEIAARGMDFDVAESHALSALEIDAEQAMAHGALAWVAMHRDWDWERAQFHIGQSLALDPDGASAHSINAMLMIIVGRRVDAKNAAITAFELDPVSSLVRTDNGWFHYYVGDYATGLQICTDAIALAPDDMFAFRCQFKSAMLIGDLNLASHAAAKIVENWGTAPELAASLTRNPGAESLQAFFELRRQRISDFRIKKEFSQDELAVASAEIGDYEAAAELLAEAMESHTPRLPFILRDPVLNPIHNDPRYVEAVNFTGITLPNGRDHNL